MVEKIVISIFPIILFLIGYQIYSYLDFKIKDEYCLEYVQKLPNIELYFYDKEEDSCVMQFTNQLWDNLSIDRIKELLKK